MTRIVTHNQREDASEGFTGRTREDHEYDLNLRREGSETERATGTDVSDRTEDQFAREWENEGDEDGVDEDHAEAAHPCAGFHGGFEGAQPDVGEKLHDRYQRIEATR